MNWEEVVKLRRDIFAYADVQIVLCTLEENGVHGLSAEGDAEFYAYDDMERYSEEIVLENLEFETHFTKASKSCQPMWRAIPNPSPERSQQSTHWSLCPIPPEETFQLCKEFIFQYSDVKDEEMILLIDMLVDARDVYSQHKFDVGKTCQKFHVTLKPKV